MACFITVLFGILFIPFVATSQPGSQPLAVIAYYSGNGTDIDRYDVHKLTHIIYCFASLKGNRLYVSTAAGNIISKLVLLKRKNPLLKVSLAFGGWGGCSACS